MAQTLHTTQHPLRIAFVIDSAGPIIAGGLVSGGRLIERLREHHQVTAIGIGGDVDLPALHLPLVDGLVSRNSFTFARPDLARMREAFRDADVVHIQLPFFLGFSAMKLAREMGKPVVAAHHVQPENVFFGVKQISPWLAKWFTGPRMSRFINRLVVKTFYDRADAVIAPSLMARDELLHEGLKVPTAVISNGAPDRFQPAPVRALNNKFTLLTVGRLVPEKRQELIIEAVQRSKHAAEIRLVVGGKGPQKEQLEALASKGPAEVKVGFVSDEELLRLYQTSDLYVHASEAELEGMAALEAMRCGCPSLISDARTSATRQFALNDDHLFPAGDLDALSKKIDFWFENRAALLQARRDTLDSVKEYSLEHCAESHLGLYQELASRKLVSGSVKQLAA